MPKTNAEYCRDYRKKKRKNKVKRIAKSSTERVREFRARRNALLNAKNVSSITHNDDLTVKNSECFTDGANGNNSEPSKDKHEESILPMSTMSPLAIKTSPKSSSPPNSPQPYLQQKIKMDDRDDDDEDDYLARCEPSPKEETKERDRMFVELEKEKLSAELEKERIRQKDVELRQRDTALQLQGQWLELAKSGLNILDKYLHDKK